MPTRRTEKQAKRFSMASAAQLALGMPKEPKPEPVPIVVIHDHICPSCDIGAHEHCTGDCDCCGTKG